MKKEPFGHPALFSIMCTSSDKSDSDQEGTQPRGETTERLAPGEITDSDHWMQGTWLP